MPALSIDGETRRVAVSGETRRLDRGSVPSSMLGGGDLAEPAAIGTTAAMRLAEVFACVRLLTHATVPLPVKLYRPGAERVDAAGSALARLIERPWPGASTPDLIGSLMTSLLLHGDAFIGLFADERGVVSQLGVLPPDAVDVTLEAGRLTYTLMTKDGVVELGERDIVHVRSPLSMPGSLRGMSPVQWLATSLGEAQELARAGATFPKITARPGLLLLMNEKSKTTQAERESLREEIDARYVGSQNAGRPMLLGGAIADAKQMTLSLADAEFIRHRELAAGTIARGFGVPAGLLDLPAGNSMSYDNAESRTGDLLRFTLEGWLVSIERALSAHSIARGVIVRVDRRALLRPDTKTRAETYALALDEETGWMSRAEVRAAEDLPSEDGKAGNDGN